MARRTLFIVMPAYNEQAHVAGVVRASRKVTPNVIVVDDGSRDGTAEAARKAGARVLELPVNMGKGFAMRTGIREALLQGAQTVATLDADGQHDPRDVPRALSEMKRQGCDMVVGSRVLSGEMPFVKRAGNTLIYLCARALFGSRITDTQSGFRVFSRQAWPRIAWRCAGYEAESEIVMNAGRHKVRTREIPIKTVYANKYKGTSVTDGLKIVAHMLWWRATQW